MGMPCGVSSRGDADADQSSMIDPSQRSPDGMRYGQLRYEVQGSDYATRPLGRDGSADQTFTFSNPATNQAGALAPTRSQWWQTMSAHATTFVRQMDPIERVKGYPNNVGRNQTRTARNIMVVADSGYDGILPLRQQPIINKPLPY